MTTNDILIYINQCPIQTSSERQLLVVDGNFSRDAQLNNVQWVRAFGILSTNDVSYSNPIPQCSTNNVEEEAERLKN